MKKLANIFKGDKVIWVIFILLSLISLVAVYSAIGRVAIFTHRTPLSAFFKHLVFVVLSYGFVIGLSNANYRKFSRAFMILYWVSVGLLLFLIIFHKGRWISIPFLGQFQPSELAKISVIIMTARLVALNQDTIQELATFGRILVFIGIVAALILPENFSTAALVMIICFIVLYFGNVNKKYWWRIVMVALVGAVVGIGTATISYRSGKYDQAKEDEQKSILSRAATWGHRIDTWLNPNPDELTQENMARMAIATGGLLGKGVGNTVQARLMTQAENDFIFAIIIEEKGSSLGVIIFFLYSILFFRCLKIARQCKGLFGSLILVGLGTLIFVQALTNMLVAVGMMPVTGQTLPLISYGGSAYLCMGMAIGVIQAIAYDTNKNEKMLQDKKRNEKDFEELKSLQEQ